LSATGWEGLIFAVDKAVLVSKMNKLSSYFWGKTLPKHDFSASLIADKIEIYYALTPYISLPLAASSSTVMHFFPILQLSTSTILITYRPA
jgi:hypothetical protein